MKSKTRNTHKRIVLFLVAFLLINSVIMPTAQAATSSEQVNVPKEIKESRIIEDVYVDDGAGNTVKVVVEEIIYHSAEQEDPMIDPLIYGPKFPIGETRTYRTHISNEVMGIPGVAGTSIGFFARTKAAQAAASAVTARLGAHFIPGLSLVSGILAIGSWVNAVTGYNGIVITTNFIYSSHYNGKGGYYTHGWDLTGVSISRY